MSKSVGTRLHNMANNNLRILIGTPKPLVYTHAFLSSNANAFSLPSPDPEYDTIGEILEDSRFICLLPLFHVSLGILGEAYCKVPTPGPRMTARS